MFYGHTYTTVSNYFCYRAFDQRLPRSTVTSFLRNMPDDAIVPFRVG